MIHRVDFLVGVGKLTLGFRFLTWLVNRDAKTKKFIEDWATCGTRNVQFDLSGEAPFFIEIGNGRATFKHGKAEKMDVILRGESSLFSKLLSGEVDQDEAYSRQRYEIIGSIDDAIRLRYLTELSQKTHPVLLGGLQRLLRMFAWEG